MAWIREERAEVASPDVEQGAQKLRPRLSRQAERQYSYSPFLPLAMADD